MAYKKTYSKAFDSESEHEYFSLLSRNYYMLAKKFARDAKHISKTHSFFTYPSVIMYFTSLEAFFNEKLAHVLLREKIKEGSEKSEIIELVNKIKGKSLSLEFLKEIYQVFGLNFKFSKELIENFILLHNIRNLLVHFEPDPSFHNYFPDRLLKYNILEKVSRQHNSDWMCYLADPSFCDFASNTVKEVINDFCRESCYPNPFIGNSHLSWEEEIPSIFGVNTLEKKKETLWESFKRHFRRF